jgi:hypothetical protein
MTIITTPQTAIVQPAKPSPLERFTRDEPRPTIRHSSYDPSQPWIDRRAISERARVEVELHHQVAVLAEDIEGVPVEQTLNQLRNAAVASIPALQPAARVRSQSEDVVQRLANMRALLSELSDLQDFVFAAPEQVSLRALLETLRHVEVELDAAVARLAGDLGLVTT